ncbi:MAG: hypothetical protein LAP87_12515 [Acidobacteriia bacterium]|nr:hypothetical protein [Terriglobia bacterium]
MDVERTIEFILQSQAKAEARAAAMDARTAATDARIAASEARFNKRMDGINKLIKHGMRMIETSRAEWDRKFNALVDAQMRTEEQLRQLAAAQKVTDKKFQAFLDSMRKGRNGRQSR